MFGFEGQSEMYAQIRPTYPECFYDRLLNELRQKKPEGLRVCLDIGTGTGQVAGILASHFDRVYGLDISDKQIQQAKIVHKDKTNLSFHVAGYLDIEKFAQEHQLIGKIDLIICAEAFHWFDEH